MCNPSVSRSEKNKIKSDWERTTRHCEYSEFRPELKMAIDSSLKEIGEDLEAVFCIETRSIRIKPGGLFNPRRKSLYHAVVITPHWLIQAIDPDDGKTEPFVIFNALNKMEITDETVKLCKKHGIRDYGIDIVSQTSRDFSIGSYFIGLEPGPASRQFLITLRLFIRSANLPPRKANQDYA